jgi:hypothetical protein
MIWFKHLYTGWWRNWFILLIVMKTNFKPMVGVLWKKHGSNYHEAICCCVMTLILIPQIICLYNKTDKTHYVNRCLLLCIESDCLLITLCWCRWLFSLRFRIWVKFAVWSYLIITTIYIIYPIITNILTYKYSGGCAYYGDTKFGVIVSFDSITYVDNEVPICFNKFTKFSLLFPTVYLLTPITYTIYGILYEIFIRTHDRLIKWIGDRYRTFVLNRQKRQIRSCLIQLSYHDKISLFDAQTIYYMIVGELRSPTTPSYTQMV